MSPRQPAWPLRALLVGLGSIAACGARTALDSSDYAQAGAGTTMMNVAGAAGASAAGSSAAGAGPLIDPAVCREFAPLWDSRAAASTLVCDNCLRNDGCGWPDDDLCASGTHCVDRRCSVLSDIATLCSCIEGCFSNKLRACDQRWSKFMTCASSVCKSACP